MKKIVFASLAVICCTLVLVGCEVQGPDVSSDPHHAQLEDSVTVFASSIDPYEKYSRNEIYAMLEEFMYAHPDVYASGFAVNDTMDNLRDFYYIYKDGTTFITIDGFDYGSVDKGVFAALQEKVSMGDQFWSRSYTREDGSGNRIEVSTFFTPIVNDLGRVVYVLTVDQIEESN